jgi:RHS repeat-associated protein
VEVKDSFGNTLAVYGYDGLNRRSSETQSGTARHFYYSDDRQVREERVGAATAAQVQYVWSPVYQDALVLRERDANGVGTDGLEERLYAQQDANWNVTAIIDVSGFVAERYAYVPFGQVSVYESGWSPQAGSIFTWDVFYQGLTYEAVVGLYDIDARFYSPSQGRFVQMDPIGFAAGYSNQYVWVGNNPASFLDPTGLKKVTIHFYYNTRRIRITPNIEKEVARIFQECISRLCKNENQIEIKFVPKTPTEYAAIKFGWYDDNNFDVGFEDTLTFPALGQSGRRDFNLNPTVIETQARMNRFDLELAIATTIAHEAGLHVIGGYPFHYYDERYVDAKAGGVGGVFSPEACKRFRDKLFYWPWSPPLKPYPHPGFCFTAGTLVQTKSGLKRIEAVGEGEEVLPWNEEVQEFQYSKVTHLIRGSKKSLVKIAGDCWEVTCSPEHPFLLADGRWKPAADIAEADCLLCRTGKRSVRVRSAVFMESATEVPVFNFGVADTHTYCILDQEIVVHNK